MPFELDDLQMSDGALLTFAAIGLSYYLSVRVYLWVRHRNRSPQEEDIETRP